ncbi:MAG: peptidylprolyl isomerase [Leptolyngbyaceae cyanobacterium CRU_2_3]|nr:peptidylprolyl isomerase [Leptolyngbyaceae cyanobacterium CRU_2_3]
MGILKVGDRLFNGDQIISALVQYKLLETLVGHVLLDKVLEEVPLTQQEVVQSLLGSPNVEVPEDFQGFLAEWCQQRNVTREYFNNVLLRELRIGKFKENFFAHQIESEFLHNKLNFDQVEYSLIQFTDLLLAQEVYFQLRDDDADFGQLAQQYSLGSERLSGGWVGPVPMSTLPPDVAMLFRSGERGAIYGPVPVGDRFWIVRLEHLATARLTEATRETLMNRLYTQWLNVQVQALISQPGAIAMQADTPQESPVSSLEMSNL